LPSFPLEVGRLKSSYMGLGEHCKLPQRGLGRRPGRNRIWCILALKYDIWLVATVLMIFPTNQNREDFSFSRPWSRAYFLNGPNAAAST